MISGLDSAYAPSAAQVIAAKTAGYQAWSGYFIGPNILNGWAWSDFQRVRAGGLATWAYVSGLADPAAMRAQSDLWGVPICLDVEGGIRGFGAWVQPWLAAAAPCGLYGNPPIHAGITAAFHICAAYPGYEPAVTWPTYISRPSTPCGWQWRGSHNEFGLTVDSVWADDAFAAAFSPGGGTIGGIDLTPEEHQWLFNAANEIRTLVEPALDRLEAGLAKVPTQATSPDTAAIVAAIGDLKAHPAVASDPALSAKIDALGKHLGLGTP